MRKFFRFEKVGIATGIFIASAIVTLYVIFFHFVDAETIDNDTMFLIVGGPFIIVVGMMIVCGILEHYDKKKAGWKRKDRGALPEEFTRGQFKGEFDS